ncbi:MAG: ABC-F family ATP-binding cassette domain-containing protein [Lachnospiraceae bacterium]|jgi:ATP-binding cassette subfamily F protein 3|nr:ABC-F family ATP-binding cassette domain-containing protein [Lachnospiraceae bacterium]
MILSVSQVSKAFGTDEILKNISFHIEDREKCALVGPNGAGKTTLLRIIAGELPPDAGQVVLAKDRTLGYLSQHQDLDSERGIYDEVLEAKKDVLLMEEDIRSLELSMKHAAGEELAKMLASYDRLTHAFERADGYAVRSAATGVLVGLGFAKEEFAMPVRTLSGGQKTRVALGKLLLSSPDLILLDEPTNHLDMDSVAWLEAFLQNYPGAVAVVAHDRYFLDRVATKIVALEHGASTVFSGNYTAYREKREQLAAARLKAYENQLQEIRHQEEVIAKLKSFNREKSIRRAESREKMLAKVDRLERPMEEQTQMHLTLEPRTVSGGDVLTIRGLGKSYDGKALFSHTDIDIKRGERVAIIGPNGTGKTTLLKTITGLVAPDTGEIRLGAKVHIGYYDQEHQVLHMGKTLFEEISDTWPALDQTTIRSLLAAFLFTGDDAFKRVGDLSGGERGRLSLAKLMLGEANFLILDEPTNHLDMVSKEVLENALCSYTGTLLYVSHDRYFINRTATRILELAGEGFTNYLGNFDYYLEKRAQAPIPGKGNHSAGASRTSGMPTETAATNALGGHTGIPTGAAPSPDTKSDWLQKKEQQAALRKHQNDLKRTEDEIAKLEGRSGALQEALSDPAIATDAAKLLELHREMESIDEALAPLYERWEALMGEAQ